MTKDLNFSIPNSMLNGKKKISNYQHKCAVSATYSNNVIDQLNSYLSFSVDYCVVSNNCKMCCQITDTEITVIKTLLDFAGLS